MKLQGEAAAARHGKTVEGKLFMRLWRYDVTEFSLCSAFSFLSYTALFSCKRFGLEGDCDCQYE